MFGRFHRWCGVCSKVRTYNEVLAVLRKASLNCSFEPKGRWKSHQRMASGLPTSQELLKQTASVQYKNTQLADVSTVEEFEQYIREPGRTSDELLAIDIRPLPPLVRLACLEGFLSAVRKEHMRTTKSHDLHLGRFHSNSDENWPTKYLMMEHLSRWSDWELGINPFGTSNRPLTQPNWIQSPRFELLLLTTAASANRLPTAQLLSLAGHLRHVWSYFDPVVYASVLRLLTSQINELSVMDLLRLAALLRYLPSERFSTSKSLGITELGETVGDYHAFVEEADLLRSALRLRVISLLPEMESIDVVGLLQMLCDMNSVFEPGDRFKLLSVIEASMITNPQQRNLYALIFIFTRLSMSKTFKRSVLNRCVGQIHRKLNLAHRFPGNDQTRWFNAVILGLANLAVGAPHHRVDSDDDSICSFVRPPIMPGPDNAVSPTSQVHCGVDLSLFISSEWIQKVFIDLTGYVASHPVTNSRSGELQAEVAYALALLGYRANSVIDQLEGHMRSSDQVKYPLLDLIELLVGPTTPNKADDINLELVCQLPRIDWQYYYFLASEALRPSVHDNEASDLLSRYTALKKEAVNTFVSFLRTRLRTNNPLESFIFHRVKLAADSEKSYFSDVTFKLQSKRNPEITKVVLCFICNGRDYLVNRPLNTVLQAYSRSADQLRCITFNYTSWVLLESPGRRMKCDQFLKELAELMADSPGVPTGNIHLWTEVSDAL